MPARIYAPRASPGDTVDIPPGTVDGMTEPSGPALQRARDDGIEEGFDIGYRAKLATTG